MIPGTNASRLDASAPPLLDWTFRAMGSDWRIHHGGGVTGADAQAVADQVDADERLWSRFLPGSDVSRVNRAAGSAVGVAPATAELVALACDWSARTDGRFQPLVSAALGRWGYRGGIGDGAPPSAPVDAAVPDASAIEMDAAARTIRIPAGTALDLGGIAKSWAAMRAGRLLGERCDDERLIVDGGGDLAIVRGTHRVETAAGAVLAAPGTGVATSSSERRRWSLGDGTRAHHLIDARTGAPGPRGTAVVAGTTPVAADVLASCLVLDADGLDALDAPAARVGVDGDVRANAAWAAVRA